MNYRISSIVVVYILVFLPANFISAQSTNDDELIYEIRNQYKVIIAAKEKGELKEHTIEYECPDYPASGEITFFSDKYGLKLIEHSSSDGSHSGGLDQYFLWNGDLFFFYSDFGSWTFDYNQAENDEVEHTIDYITESRYYFNNGTAFKCLEKNYEVYSSRKDNLKSEDVENEDIDCEAGPDIIDKLVQIQGFKYSDTKEIECIWD